MKQTVKVCGQTDPEIIKLCIEQGAKLIGFIINYPKSPRSISIEQLKSLTKNIPDNIKKVAVMVNPSIEQVKEISDKEYNEFKEYQRRKHFEIHQKQLSQMEGFSNVNDDFNDVLLFGLLGVFFLIFTDYIYKLGRKSY